MILLLLKIYIFFLNRYIHSTVSASIIWKTHTQMPPYLTQIIEYFAEERGRGVEPLKSGFVLFAPPPPGTIPVYVPGMKVHRENSKGAHIPTIWEYTTNVVAYDMHLRNSLVASTFQCIIAYNLCVVGWHPFDKRTGQYTRCYYIGRHAHFYKG